jgi:hypothetical protein
MADGRRVFGARTYDVSSGWALDLTLVEHSEGNW